MAKTKTNSQVSTVFGQETGFVEKMKVAAIENADNNVLFELALKHLHCDNPSPSAVKDFLKELRSRLRARELDLELEMLEENY